MKEFVTVGKVKDAHGLKGELYITLFAREAEWLERLNEIRLTPPEVATVAKESEKETQKVLPSAPAVPMEPQTFAVKSARLHKNGLIVLSPGIRGRNEAEKWKGWLLEIPGEFLVSEEGDEIFLAEVEGFKVTTKSQGEVGVIVGFSSNGMQDLLVVRTPSRGEYEIPFVDAFVTGIDYESGVVHMDLPEGLLGEAVDTDERPEPSADDDSAD